MCYHVVFGQVNVCMQDFFEFNNASHSQTRGHPYKLYKRHSHSSVRTSYFAVRIINMWNTLPADRADFSFSLHLNRLYNRLIYQCFIMLNN